MNKHPRLEAAAAASTVLNGKDLLFYIIGLIGVRDVMWGQVWRVARLWSEAFRFCLMRTKSLEFESGGPNKARDRELLKRVMNVASNGQFESLRLVDSTWSFNSFDPRAFAWLFVGSVDMIAGTFPNAPRQVVFCRCRLYHREWDLNWDNWLHRRASSDVTLDHHMATRTTHLQLVNCEVDDSMDALMKRSERPTRVQVDVLEHVCEACLGKRPPGSNKKHVSLSPCINGHYHGRYLGACFLCTNCLLGNLERLRLTKCRIANCKRLACIRAGCTGQEDATCQVCRQTGFCSHHIGMCFNAKPIYNKQGASVIENHPRTNICDDCARRCSGGCKRRFCADCIFANMMCEDCNYEASSEDDVDQDEDEDGDEDEGDDKHEDGKDGKDGKDDGDSKDGKDDGDSKDGKDDGDSKNGKNEKTSNKRRRPTTTEEDPQEVVDSEDEIMFDEQGRFCDVAFHCKGARTAAISDARIHAFLRKSKRRRAHNQDQHRRNPRRSCRRRGK